jgi:cyclic beta-1,2-glucan synthetase
MATQHYPGLESGQSLPGADSLRDGARRKEYCGSTTRHRGTVQYGQLWLGAFLEAWSWKVREKNTRIPAFEAKWQETADSIETRCEILRNLAAAGNRLREDAAILLGNSDRLRQSLQRTKEAIREAGEQPQVEIADGWYVPRVYAAVASYLQAVNYEFDERTFEQFFTAIQEAMPFDMAELWQLHPFTEFALLERVAARADQLDAAATYSDMTGPTVAAEATVSTGYFQTANLSTQVESLRRICGVDWNELFEKINATEHILRQDPCGAYGRMDFGTRDTYRKTIAEMAIRSNANEQEVARKAIELSQQPHFSTDQRIRERESHVGYYLVAEGRKALEEAIGYRPTSTERVRAFIKRWPDFSYILGIELATLALMAVVIFEAKIKFSGLVAMALFLLPAAECAVALINQFATALFPPKALPKLDFSDGIPDEFTTMVVVPTLLTGE